MDSVDHSITESEIVYDPRFGHSHDGSDSKGISIPAASITLSNLDSSVVDYIQSVGSASSAGVVGVSNISFSSGTIAAGAAITGQTTWVSLALIISTKVDIVGNSNFDLKLYHTNSYLDADLEFHSSNITNGFKYGGVWAHNDTLHEQSLYWKLSNTGSNAASATVTLQSGTSVANTDTSFVNSVALFGSSQTPATGQVILASGTGVNIIQNGDLFTFTSAPLNGPDGQPPAIPAPTNLQLSTDINNNAAEIIATWTSPDPSQALFFQVELTEVGVGVISTGQTTESTFTFGSAIPVKEATQYSIRVQAISSGGQMSTYAGPVTITSASNSAAPHAPINFSVGFGFKTVTLEWDKSTLDNNLIIDHYITKLDTVNTFNSVDLQIHDPVFGLVDGFLNLVSGTTYYIKVAAVTASGVVGPYTTAVSGLVGTLNSVDFSDASITAVNLNMVIGGDNKMLNGSFEADSNGDNLADSWNIYNSPSLNTAPTPTIETSIYYHGSKSQKLVWSGNTGYKGLYQTAVPLKATQYNTVTFLVYASSTSNWSIACSQMNPSFGPTKIVSPNVWTRVTYTGLALADLGDVYLRCDAAALTVRIDAAMTQEGDVATAFVPKADEILPFTIYGQLLQQETIDSTRIQNDAITEAKLITDAVSNRVLANDAVQTINIVDAAILNAKIGDLEVGTGKIADAAITSVKIGTAQVLTANIGLLQVTTAVIADAAIEEVKIKDLAVTNAKIGALAVDTAQIKDAAITNLKIGNLAVDTAQIKDAAITNLKIGNLAVDTAQIHDGAILNAKIGNAQINDAKITDLTVDKITSGSISASTITVNSSGVLRTGQTGSPFNYLLFDANGIRGFNGGSSAFSGGTKNFEFNVSTGNVYLSGQINASSGNIGGYTIASDYLVGGQIASTTSTSKVLIGASGTYGGASNGITFVDASGGTIVLTGAAGALQIAGGTNVTGALDLSSTVNHVNVTSEITMNDNFVRFRADNNHAARWVNSIDTPAGSIQNVDGPVIHGFDAVVLGSVQHGNLASPGKGLLRVFHDGSTNRIDFYVTSVQTAGSKAFGIDHPILGIDHELLHVTVESPRADLIYRGKATLINGTATIDIDDYYLMTTGTFAALNKNIQVFLYNETGDSNPKYNISGSKITITCKDKTATIGWMVVGERADQAIAKDESMVDEHGSVINERRKPQVDIDALVDSGKLAKKHHSSKNPDQVGKGRRHSKQTKELYNVL